MAATQFVLIHGAWHGGWCWEKVRPLLEKAACEVYTPDLPGLGDDITPIQEISLATYVDSIVTLLGALPSPVVLAGHSMGGIVISAVAEQVPEKISTLIYVTGHSPKDGESLLQNSLEDRDSLLRAHRQIHKDEGYALIAADKVKECFYHLCADADVAKAIPRLKPQALAPMLTALSLSKENYGRVRRCYIKCSEDRAITPCLQQRYMDNFPWQDSVTLKSDHSPFYSCPEELVEALLKLQALE